MTDSGITEVRKAALSDAMENWDRMRLANVTGTDADYLRHVIALIVGKTVDTVVGARPPVSGITDEMIEQAAHGYMHATGWRRDAPLYVLHHATVVQQEWLRATVAAAVESADTASPRRER